MPDRLLVSAESGAGFAGLLPVMVPNLRPNRVIELLWVKLSRKQAGVDCVLNTARYVSWIQQETNNAFR
jgi:hypothetical protein